MTILLLLRLLSATLLTCSSSSLILTVFLLWKQYIWGRELLLDALMSVHVKKILIDSLKSRELSIVDLSKALGSLSGVTEVNIVVVEVDSNTETLKVTMQKVRFQQQLLIM